MIDGYLAGRCQHLVRLLEVCRQRIARVRLACDSQTSLACRCICQAWVVKHESTACPSFGLDNRLAAFTAGCQQRANLIASQVVNHGAVDLVASSLLRAVFSERRDRQRVCLQRFFPFSA